MRFNSVGVMAITQVSILSIYCEACVPVISVVRTEDELWKDLQSFNVSFLNGVRICL